MFRKKSKSQQNEFNIWGKIPKEFSSSPQVKICNWVNDINDIYIYKKNDCFLVTYYLGSGMQSKVFKPLVKGKILICEPRALADYGFIPFNDYLPAKSEKDFMWALNWVLDN
jgi:hypothetical protein